MSPDEGPHHATSAPLMSPEVWIFGGAGLISLLAFTVLILVPAIGSFGRPWEKATAAMLSLIVLVALVSLGVAIGVAVVYYWDDISRLL
jgi:ABC-type transport system involved in multi-copper enzyme maturation permease subunit